MKKVLKYFLSVCFSQKGRINRAWWWIYISLFSIFHWVLDDTILDNTGEYGQTLFFFSGCLVLGMTYSLILVCVKRFRDTHRSGWNMLWVLIPAFGVLYILIVCGFFKGTDGENKYGEPSSLIGDSDSFTQRKNTENNHTQGNQQ